MQCLALVICLATLLAGPALSRTWHVPSEAPTIQTGIDVASAGDSVEVACGIYYEHDIIMKSGVALRSETGDAECVVIDAQGQGRILNCVDLLVKVSVAGLTFRGGNGPDGWLESLGGGIRCSNSDLVIANCVFIENSARIGAGLGVLESTIDLSDCTFTSNSATHGDWAAGGGIWCRDSSGGLRNCTFTSNSAFSENVDTPGDGGGVYCNNTRLDVTDCTFIENSTGGGAGAWYSFRSDAPVLTRCSFEGNNARGGGAMYLEGSSAQLYECTFRENTATIGGAIVMAEWSSPKLNNCIFESNESNLWSGGAVDCWQSDPVFWRCTFRGNIGAEHGGGMSYGTDALPQLDECIFWDNETPGRGGAISCRPKASLQLTNCTIAGNSAATGGGISCDVGASATLERTIIAFSLLGESVAGAENAVNLVCCNVYGNAGGDWIGGIADQDSVNGNFSADPCFCEANKEDSHLCADSWCLPENNLWGCTELVGAFGQGCGACNCPSPLPVTLRSWGGVKAMYR